MPAGRSRASTRRTRIRKVRVAGLLVVAAAIAAGLGYGTRASSSSTAFPSLTAVSSPTAAPPIDGGRGERRRPRREPHGAVPDSATVGDRPGPLGLADGVVPDGTTVLDGEVPGVANLDADLLGALRRAATAAADDGVGFVVDSGWRSPEYQRRLLREAVSKYGSEAEAARWVATPTRSAHVSGDAVDIGAEATRWLSRHGAEYGLCQIYRNEPWHYELRPEAIDRGCPAMYADPTHDPRMEER